MLVTFGSQHTQTDGQLEATQCLQHITWWWRHNKNYVAIACKTEQCDWFSGEHAEQLRMGGIGNT